MKKESFGNLRKCLDQKNLDTSGFEIPEISLIIYERDNHMYMREVTDFIDKFKKA